MKSRAAACLSLELSVRQFSARCRGSEGRCSPVPQRGKAHISLSSAAQGLLQRLRDGANHMRRLCGCWRGTKEGVGLVPLMISQVRRN